MCLRSYKFLFKIIFFNLFKLKENQKPGTTDKACLSWKAGICVVGGLHYPCPVLSHTTRDEDLEDDITARTHHSPRVLMGAFHSPTLLCFLLCKMGKFYRIIYHFQMF